MKIAIIINSKRLTPELKSTLESSALTEKYGITYDIFIVEPGELNDCFKKLNYESYNACLVGGGDGTVCSAARFLANYQLPLIVLPLGTFNVLAKSLEYPNDIDAIFSIIKNNKTKQIDLGEVNGLIFVNHAWLGSYYYILKMRERYKNTFGRSRLLKAVFNAFWMFKHLPIYHFKTTVDNRERVYKTCLILISNNESTNDFFNFGERPLLATGMLHVNILNCHTRWQLLKCMFSVMLGRADYIHQFFTDEITLSATTQQVNIVLDGELEKMESPLHFLNIKNKLNVITV